METNPTDIMRAAARIAEVARIGADEQVAIQVKLITHLLRQVPELLCDLVDYALRPALLPQEARDLIEAATEQGRPGDAASPYRIHAAGADPVAQPQFAVQERPIGSALRQESLMPKSAQEPVFSGTNPLRPRAPEILEQYSFPPYVQQFVTTSWADLAQGANPAPDSFELVPHRGEAIRLAELDQDTGLFNAVKQRAF